jgi:hypothetical protein
MTDDVTREQYEALRAQRVADEASLEDAERERQRTLHWMRCCKCGATMDEIVFRGVRVDKCLRCGGVYLDDGELEQLVGKPGWIQALRSFFGS